jgi:threonine dehydrogenase-like Zn-dependent dehydrogenase
MRTLVFQGPERLTIEERDVPEPGPGEALVRVEATGICGSDLHGYMGKTGRRHPGQVMGHEVVGTVESLADDGPAPGTTVAVYTVIACGECPACLRGADNLCRTRRLVGVDADILGGFSEYMTAPAANLVPLPGQMPARLGALVEPLSVGYRSVLQGAPEPGEVVVVIGGGQIGIACLLAARRLEAGLVVLSEPNDHRRSVAAELGAQVVNPRSEDLPARVAELTDGAGSHCVIDCVGTSQTLQAALDACASEGTVVLVGMESPRLDLSTYDVITHERRLVGNFGYTARHFRETAEWVGTVPDGIAACIEDVVGFEAAIPRIHALATGADPAVKVLIDPRA